MRRRITALVLIASLTACSRGESDVDAPGDPAAGVGELWRERVALQGKTAVGR